MNKYNLK